MIITSKPGNGDKVHIYLDNEYAFTLYDDYWHRLGIAEKSDISEDELAPLKEEAGFRSAYEKGLKYLSMRGYSEKELILKLRQKYGASPSVRAVEKLKKLGYIDDEAFAQDYSQYLFEKKQYDIKRISYELKTKGIDAETVSKTLKTLDNEPIQRIILMLKSKYENSLENEKEVKRLVSRFVRMGYAFSDIKSAFSQCGVEIPGGFGF